MYLSKKTIQKCHEAGANVYSAKKRTNRHGSVITVTYANRLFKNGVCTAVTTERTAEICGDSEQDILNYFLDEALYYPEY